MIEWVCEGCGDLNAVYEGDKLQCSTCGQVHLGTAAKWTCESCWRGNDTLQGGEMECFSCGHVNLDDGPEPGAMDYDLGMEEGEW